MSCNREYYNQFDRSKKYFEIRQLSGDVRQSREDNEEQAILRDLLQRVADGIWLDGDIVKDCALSPVTGGYQVGPGWVYADGIVHETSLSAVLAVGSVGNQYVGFRVNSRVVTFQDDASLKDVATGVANEGLPGADRLELQVEWVTGAYKDCGTPIDGSGNPVTGIYPVYKFRDGVLLFGKSELEPGALMPALHDRTARLHGDIVLSGLEMLTGTDKPTTAGQVITMTFSPGAALIDGQTYRVSEKRPFKVDLDLLASAAGKQSAKEVGTLSNVPYVAPATSISLSTPSGGTRTLKRVMLSVQVSQTVKRGALAANGIFEMDQLLAPLPGVSVTRILSVTYNGTTYSENTGRNGDYRLVPGTILDNDGNSVPVSYIDWSARYTSSIQPPNDADYTVVMVYEKVLDPTDYAVNAGDHTISPVLPGGVFANSEAGTGTYKVSAAVPYTNGYWNIDYESTDLTFDVYFRALCDGEFAWGIKDFDSQQNVLLQWLDQSNPTTPVWVRGVMPQAIHLGTARIVSDGGTGYEVTFVSEDHRHVTQQQLREMLNRYTSNERFIMDLMSHSLRVSSYASNLVAGDSGFDALDPKPKRMISYFPDGRNVITDYDYYETGFLRTERVWGKDAKGNTLYSGMTSFDYSGQSLGLADVSDALVTFAVIS